ncbi:MAG: hypothetical protein APF77_23425 [Clostridia bacterium BRH_c25]|nr:MAG: hypothetical protein APF77_23425 [Clostridia bacterium BRH_c25]
MSKKSYILLLLTVVSSFIFCFRTEDWTPEFIYSGTKGGAEAEILVNSKEVKRDDKELFFNKPLACPSNSYIKIYKRPRLLELYGDGKLLGRFRIALGRSPEGDKAREGDSKTPEGKYYICTKNESSKFTLFLGLSYPNTEDAVIGLKNNIISQEEYNLIKTAEEQQQRPPWNTALGGQVGIHGGGNTSDWTQGCIAMSDKDIHIIWAYTALKTPVEIFE